MKTTASPSARFHVTLSRAGRTIRTLHVSYPLGTSPAEVASHVLARRQSYDGIGVRRAYDMPGLSALATATAQR